MTNPCCNEPEISHSESSLTKVDKIKSLSWQYAFTATNSIATHLTFTGSLFVLYLNELGINKSQLGIILSIVPFVNVLSMFFANKVSGIGVRKVFLHVFSIRYLIWTPIIISPWIRKQFGSEVMVILIVSIVGAFSFLRMLNMVALLPWRYEIIPESIRGVVLGKQMAYGNIANIIAVTLAGLYIEHAEGIKPFNALFILGVVFGLLSAWEASHFPGGDSKVSDGKNRLISQTIKILVKDLNFRKYIYSIGWIILAESLFSFVALYMYEEIGLNTGQIVFLQTSSLVGGALTSYFWGLAADRFGGKLVLQVNMALISILPILWFVMPHQSHVSIFIGMGISFLQGSAQIGRLIGDSRLLYNKIIPLNQTMLYMALYNGWLGLVIGMGQLFGGVLLYIISDISVYLLGFSVNEYSLIFGLLFIFAAFGIISSSFIKAKGEMGIRKFLGMFFG